MPASPNARQRLTGAREAAIVRAIIARLNALPGCLARKRHITPYAVAGDPDVYGCYRGQHFELEVKRPGVDRTKPARQWIQQQRRDAWQRAGAVVAVVTSADEAVQVVTGGAA